MDVTRNSSYTCLCTRNMCAKFKCSGEKIGTHLIRSCKIEMVHSDQSDCKRLTETNSSNYEHIYARKYICTNCGEKMFSIKEIFLDAMEFSDIETRAILALKESDNVNVKSPESQHGFFDILRNCCDAETPLFVTRRKSLLYLCVIRISKSVCIISKCKEKEMPNAKTENEGQQESHYLLRNFKEYTVLVFSGVLVFGGVIGFLIGVRISRYRKIRQYHDRERRFPRNTCDSEIYAEISKLREETNSLVVDALEIDDMETTCTWSARDSPLPTRINIQGTYSSVYNALQPNYGQRRGSSPVGDTDTKKM